MHRCCRSGAGDWKEFEGLQLGEVGWVHRRCALWSFNPALRSAALDPSTHVKRECTGQRPCRSAWAWQPGLVACTLPSLTAGAAITSMQ